MHISPAVQNAIITACEDVILRKIVTWVNCAEGFTVVADETTDFLELNRITRPYP
jgi:hypothetical protein